jgi:hypothetical protein
VFGWVIAAVLAALAGCRSDGASSWGSPSAEQSVVVGDWNDVHAAVMVAVGQNETAIVTWSSSDTEKVFQLRTVRDQDGRLIARRDPSLGAIDPGPIHLSCSIGRFGNAPLERSIIRATARRLEDLKGVEFRPLR